MNDLTKMVEDTARPPATVKHHGSILFDPVLFAHVDKVADRMVRSALWPQHLRGNNDIEVAKANATMVMNMAYRQGQDPLMVAQNIYFVGGKPGWSTAYLIGLTRQAGVFTGPIMFDTTGEGNDLKVVARAEMVGSKETVTAEASMKMAKAEGWTKNPKYASMPEVMLRYRAATFLIRLYCPEVMLGIGAVEEMEDVRAAEARDITPQPKEPAKKPDPETAKPKPKAEDAEVVEDEPKGSVKTKPKNDEKPKKEPTHDAETGEVKEDAAEAEDAPDLEMDEETQASYEAVLSAATSATSLDDLETIEDLYSETISAMGGEVAKELRSRIATHKKSLEGQR